MQIKFLNRSYIIASSIAGIVISIALLLPFVVMSILTINYGKYQSKKFQKKYGAVIEGVEVASENPWKANYYSIFLMQRIGFAAILVFLYSEPLIQCILFTLLNVFMMLYVGCVKPFSPCWERLSVIYDEVVLVLF